MDGDLKQDSDVIIVITRATNDPRKPRHHLLTFDRTAVEADTSKLYIFNGIWSKEHHDENIGTTIQKSRSYFGVMLYICFRIEHVWVVSAI